MFTILSRIRLVCCCLLLMLGMGLISKLRDGWSRQLCASLLAKVLRCRLVFGVIRSPALAIKIQTSRLQTSPQIILDNEQLEPYGALEISMKKTTHGPWPPQMGPLNPDPLGHVAFDQPGRGNQCDQPDGFQRPVGGNLRRAPEGAFLKMRGSELFPYKLHF